MPAPTCQSIVAKVSGRILVLRGTNSQEEDGRGRPTIPTSHVRAYDPERNEWEVLSSLSNPTKSGGMAWFDYNHQRLFVVRQNPQRPTMSANEGRLVPRDHKVQHVQHSGEKYRRVTLKGFRKCLQQRGGEGKPSIENVSFLDGKDDETGASSNRRLKNAQLPDLICFPSNVEQVSLVAQCAKRNGYRVCTRNDKQSVEGDSCAFGILVDVSNLEAMEVVDREAGHCEIWGRPNSWSSCARVVQ